MGADELTVEIVWSPAERQLAHHVLQVMPGTTAAQALQLAQTLGIGAPASGESWTVAVWGKVRPADYTLRSGDRIELLRPLRVDPKEARRQRYRRDGSSR